MRAPITIEDAADERLADYHGLREPERRMRVETSGGYLIVESVRAIRTLLASGRAVRSLLLHPRELARLEGDLVETDVPVYVATAGQLEAITGFDVHRGALASAERFPPVALEGLVATADRLVALEGLTDHSNLGAIFRSAAGFGYGGVLLDGACGDPLYRRSVRVSIGHTLTLPFARTARLAETLPTLHAAGFTTVALTPSRDALDISGLPAFRRIALLLGTEGPGLTGETQGLAQVRVRIPLERHVDSLNVAVAASLAMWALSLDRGARAVP